VGIAVSDTSGSLAFPKIVLQNDSRLVENVIQLAHDEGAVGVVVGESTDLKGNDNPIMETLRDFKQMLEDRSGVPVYFQPEFFTSAEAAREFGEDEAHDARAAALILQRFLDIHVNGS
jgi:RNase H-fold protein (predicted Holliday junction resolvase)